MASCRKKVYKVMCEQPDKQRAGRYRKVSYQSRAKKGTKGKASR